MDFFSLVRYEVNNFHNVMLSSRPFFPITTLLIKIVLSLIEAENEPDSKMKERVEWLYENTHAKVNEHLSVIELVVFKNLNGGLSKDIEIGQKTFTLTELYKYLDEVVLELSRFVVEISKKYNLEFPITTMHKSQQINLEN
jgi:hypothetical protein